jgi:hypothetical protein
MGGYVDCTKMFFCNPQVHSADCNYRSLIVLGRLLTFVTSLQLLSATDSDDKNKICDKEFITNLIIEADDLFNENQ